MITEEELRGWEEKMAFIRDKMYKNPRYNEIARQYSPLIMMLYMTATIAELGGESGMVLRSLFASFAAGYYAAQKGDGPIFDLDMETWGNAFTESDNPDL